jgi:hypothetical protein
MITPRTHEEFFDITVAEDCIWEPLMLVLVCVHEASRSSKEERGHDAFRTDTNCASTPLLSSIAWPTTCQCCGLIRISGSKLVVNLASRVVPFVTRNLAGHGSRGNAHVRSSPVGPREFSA